MSRTRSPTMGRYAKIGDIPLDDISAREAWLIDQMVPGHLYRLDDRKPEEGFYFWHPVTFAEIRVPPGTWVMFHERAPSLDDGIHSESYISVLHDGIIYETYVLNFTDSLHEKGLIPEEWSDMLEW